MANAKALDTVLQLSSLLKALSGLTSLAVGLSNLSNNTLSWSRVGA